MLQGLTGIPTLYNATTETGAMGPEKAGLYKKKNHDTNFSVPWVIAFAMATVFFLIHWGLQQKGYVDPPIVRDGPKKLAPEEEAVEAKGLVLSEA